jgi:hypothetical protein
MLASCACCFGEGRSCSVPVKPWCFYISGALDRLHRYAQCVTNTLALHARCCTCIQTRTYRTADPTDPPTAPT